MRYFIARLQVARLLIVGLAFGLMSAASLANAADETASNNMPRCEPATLGATACMGGVLCECVQTRGGSITGQLSGAQWNCDALRPRCGTEAATGDGGVPASIPYTEFPYPHSVGIDRSSEKTIIKQEQTANPDNSSTNTNN